MKHTSREISGRAELERLDKQVQDQMQQQLREMDRHYTEQLYQRYRSLVPPERIHAMKDLPTVFEDRKHFEQSYLRADGMKPAENVVGFSQGTSEPAHVATDHLQMRKTIIHERLHQLSDPRAVEQLGRGLDEGITEDLAIDELGSEWNPELLRSYPEQRALAHNLRDLCGNDSINDAYFQGDVGKLRICLDDRLGKGSLDKLKEMADSPDAPEQKSGRAEGDAADRQDR